MNTTPTPQSPEPRQLLGGCDGCGQYHAASYSHEGHYGEGPVYAVVCPVDHLTTYVTTEGLAASVYVTTEGLGLA